MTTYACVRVVAVALVCVLTAKAVSAQEPAATRLKLPTEISTETRQGQARDPLWNGALIGAGVGFGFALYDYLIDPSEPDNGIIFATAIGLGAAIGAGIDALIKKDPQPQPSLRVVPVLRRDQKGVVVSARF